MKVGDLKKLLETLPNGMEFCEEDSDTAHLVVRPEQFKIDGGHLLFTPIKVWMTLEEDNNQTA